MRATRGLGPLLVLLTLAPASAARDLPPPEYPVRDEAGLLDEATRVQVERACVAVDRETGAQLGVLITDTTAGEDPNRFAHRVYDHWGVGQQGRGNGALLLFAMRDRRIELAPGWEYEELFTEDACKRLLGQAVPHMRSGRPREGVLTVVRAVAERIRQHEALKPVAADLAEGRVELDEFGGGSTRRPASAHEERAPATSGPAGRAPSATPVRSSAPTLPPVTSWVDRDTFRRASVLLVLALWAAGLVYCLWAPLTTGRLVLGAGLITALALLVPVAVIALLALTTHGGIERMQGPDWGLGGGGLAGGVIAAGVARHICPRCSRWMSIHSRTLRSATYHSSGTGERTYHCRHCSYHRVTTYTIPRRTRSTSSSSSRGSYGSSSRSSGGGGGRSFGGGSSRGGGGGVSW